MRNWLDGEYDIDLAEKIAEELGISCLLAEILVKRGLTNPEETKQFLYGKREDLSDPFQLNDMDIAVTKIKQAIAAGEKIVIYGDYDVDGVCSIVILLECLRLLGGDCSYYVPDRFTEGYGLNLNAVVELAAEGCRLLITVDCGISSLAESQKAQELGMDLIITDHHRPLEQLPPATAIINPKLGGIAQNIDLAGAGVAYQLAAALCQGKTVDQAEKGMGVLSCDQMVTKKLDNWLELAALATVADIVPLQGDNRIIVKYGLKIMEQTTRPGLRALLRETALTEKTLRTWHIAFVLGPRLNAAGRMNSASNSIELLLAREEKEADALATFLCRANEERRNLEEAIFQEAVKEVEKSADLKEGPILVLGGEKWHDGVIGIVASRLTERYRKPCILISWEGDIGKGSARSLAGIDIFAALEYASDYLLRYGGHKMAAGLRLERGNFTAAKEKILEWGWRQEPSSFAQLKHQVDAEIKASEISEDLLRELELLQPCGEGNPVPLFLLRWVSINSAFLIGKGREHFKLITEPHNLEGIAFNQAKFMELPWRCSFQDLQVELAENEYRGLKKIQLKVKDMQSSFMSGDSQASPIGMQRAGKLLADSMKELRGGRPVLFVYPTARLLKRGLTVLQNYLQSAVLKELHGLLTIGERQSGEARFRRGQPYIYLMTQEYFRYYLSKSAFPAHLRLILEMWEGTTKGIPDNGDILQEVVHPSTVGPNWQRAVLELDDLSPTWIYTNRKKTVANLKQSWPKALVQTGTMKLAQLRGNYRSARRAGTAIFLSDRVFAGVFPPGDEDKLYFADVPFSIYEAISAQGQMAAAGEGPLLALFDEQGVEGNWDYLRRSYPDMVDIKAWLLHLISLRRNPIRFDLHHWPAAAEELPRRELLPVLCVLSDLDLCRWRKEGSIIEIKLLRPDSTTVNLANSPFYLEGQAEKKHYQDLANQIKESLEW